MTRGCPNSCAFCAVPQLEPDYCNYIGIKNSLATTERLYGAKKDLLLMDNNVFASSCYDKIIDEIRDCGFRRGATYIPPNEYDIVIENLRAPEKEHRNVRGYITKMLKIYDQITLKLPDYEQGEFCLRREKLRLYYPGLATKENIIAFDEIAKPLYDKFFKRYPRIRYIDFNQGVDARLVTDEKNACRRK